MELINIANEIKLKINELEKIRKVIKERGENKARTIAIYDKEMAISILKLKQEGQSVTLIKDLAKGENWEKRLAMETADALMKSATSNLQTLIVEITAMQSLLKHLDVS
jgi:hypothetical protein